MSEWRKERIGDLGRVVTGKTPPTADRENFDGPYPFITIPDLDGTQMIEHSARSLSERGAAAVKSSLLPPGSVMMSCIATVGKCGITTKHSFTNQQINSLIPKDGVDARFVYYAFKLLGRELEGAGGGGSVYTNVSKGRFSDLFIRIPSLGTQRLISSTLSVLDDKIELNRRMNETLEAMAQAIFRDWFIDFGPVRRKLAGATNPIEIMGGVTTDPKRAAELTDLFPERLSDDELPEGWSLSSIYDHAAVIYGAPFSSERFNTEGRGRPLVRIRDLSNHVTTLFTDEVHPKEYEIKPGDIVVGMDGEFRARLWMGAPSLMNQRVCTFTPKASTPTSFVLLAIRPLLELLEKTAIGTTVIHLGKKDIDGFSVVHPGAPLLKAFGEIADPMLSRGVAAGVESRSLAETRDYLLPRLMSGEVTVREAAQEVAA